MVDLETLGKEFSLFQLNIFRQLGDLKMVLDETQKVLLDLSERVKVLEEARQRQIQINTELLDKEVKTMPLPPVPQRKKSFLELKLEEFFKKK